MADKEQASVGVVSTLTGFRDAVNAILEPITRDGTLEAAFRQGADEIGIALKAFPESIHASEPGGLLDPTQGEIAADRRPPSPSEIAKDKTPYVPENNQEQDRGMGR